MPTIRSRPPAWDHLGAGGVAGHRVHPDPRRHDLAHLHSAEVDHVLEQAALLGVDHALATRELDEGV
ncbi:MAG: hypothetical protein ACYTG1_13685 [Planctomycetota bacterium]